MNMTMHIDFDFRVNDDNIEFDTIVEHMLFVVNRVNTVLGKKYEWYETGYSRKQALSHIAFNDEGMSETTYLKWHKRYKKEAPIFIDGIWNGLDDETSSGITYNKMHFDEPNRASINCGLSLPFDEMCVEIFQTFIMDVALQFNCSNIRLDSRGFRRGLTDDGRAFPDRLPVKWMLYVPHTLTHELLPEAAKLIPVVDNGVQKGTIIVTMEEVFDANIKEHVWKSNDIEIKLLDLGLLPLMTEL